VIRRSTDETDQLEAIKKARKLKEGATPVKDPANLSILVEQYLTKRLTDGISENYVKFNMAQILRAFASAHPKITCREVSSTLIQTYLNGLDVKDNTRSAYNFQFKKFFEWLQSTGRVFRNPAVEANFKKARRSTRKVWLRKPQINQLIDACSNRELKYCLYCGFHAGLRREEVVMSRPEWFDLDIGEYGVLHVTRSEDWQPKDRDERTIPLSPEFRTFLTEYGFPKPYMIAPHKVTKVGRYRVEFRTAFENFIKAQGVDITFHDTRRSFASNLVSAGVSLYKVAKYLGDNHSVVEASYGHLDPSDDELARVFPARLRIVK
jgi:integrase